MARKLRIEYPGAIYHVMNRGDRQEPIFEDDSDRERFQETLAQACLKTGWQVHAYCHYGEEISQSAQEKARGIIAEELAKLGWTEGQVGQRRKGDAGKVRIARRLRREATVSKRWIAQQLSMGSVSNVAYCLARRSKR